MKRLSEEEVKRRHKLARHKCYVNRRELELRRNREWCTSNKERRARTKRSDRLRRDYGITLDRYESMIAEQHGRCAICACILTYGKTDRTKAVIDHCHDTGITRGIVCVMCNGVLGYSRDSTLILTSTIEYMYKWRK
jgi:hypothetical protein